MRHIGTVSNEKDTQRLAGYLLTRGIQSSSEPEGDGWAVWIHDEDQVESAREELRRFLQAPDDDRYIEAATAAAHLTKAARKRERQTQRQVVDVRRQWERPLLQACPVTFGLIALSVLTVIVTTDWQEGIWRFGNRNYPVLERMRFATYWNEAGVGVFDRSDPFRDIAAGQIWRIVTPIFLHFNLLHILFNMMLTRDLGAAVEYRRGSVRMLGLVIAIAVVSNTFQFVMMRAPLFGGMSGVVYGLVGYIWMKSRFDPQAGLVMPRQLLIWAVAWFVICLVAPTIHAANWAHGMGLVTGVVLGYLPVLWRKAA